ncbi:Ribosomal RNA processing protein 1 B [Desmophyllum pertusum]|uniref:Ribosomal RNA processing protein 1 B n=1 Tax=Desmophyllum pertusum TaxID=174260 RepID=A0A9X0CGJ7_9CNID|nr:Ribosomal RNA processing protein 1 B [Desmophyllum pertusum]
MAAGGAEEHFAKKLANNEKIIRDKAVNKLRAWIRSRPKDSPGFSEVDLLKIWKGLFYCMWMSDKPLIQEELALNISQLIVSFRNGQSVVLFIKTFFKTMQREWHGIDRLRLDKFYLLIRFFVKETFNFLKKSGWEDQLVSEVSSIFNDEPMNPTSQAVPDGIRLHLISVYLVELGSIINDQVQTTVLLKLLDPLFLLAAHSKSKNSLLYKLFSVICLPGNNYTKICFCCSTTVTSAVRKSLFEYLVQCDTDESDEKQKTVAIKVDFTAVADRLFTLASDRNILGRNRKQLFGWAKRLRKSTGEHEEGHPVQHNEILNGIPVVGLKRKAACEPSDVTNGVTEDNYEGKNHAKEGKRKRKKKKHSDEKIEKEEEKHTEEFTEEKEKPKGKRKKSEENLGNTVSCLGEGVTPEEGKVELKKKKKKKKSPVDDNDRTTTSKKSNSDHKHGLEESGITNGDNSSEEQQSNEPLVNGSSENDSSAVNGDLNISPENNDQALSSRVTRKALRRATGPNSEAFAKFQKNSTPPAFVRKCLAKTPSTEPRKSKTNRVKNQPPGSAPAKGSHKKVRIEMSKNTAHTTQDYQRSLKDSPKIPFDAQKTPTQGLLKSPPQPRRIPMVVRKAGSSTDPGQRRKKQPKAAQRPKAFDFF